MRTKRWLLENNTMRDFGQLYDCGDSRDGRGYVDVTDSTDPEALAARKLLLEIVADKPVPDVPLPKAKAAGKGNCEYGSGQVYKGLL